MEKAQARSNGLTARDSLDTDTAEKYSDIIIGKFIEEFSSFNSFLCYASIKSEVRTQKLIKILFEMNRKVYLPKITDGNIGIGLYGGEGSLVKGAYGVSEPVQCAPIEKIDVAVVPGTAFDRKCVRTGYGKGYYDRLLKQSRTGIIVGFAFECQVVDDICAEPHDVPCGLLITEKYIYRRNS